MYKLPSQKNKKSESQIQNKQAVPMLSELFIQLPKPNTGKKQSETGSQQQLVYEYQPFPQIDDNINDKGSRRTHNNQIRIASNTLEEGKNIANMKTKRTDQQIILGWIRNIFQKRNLLGPHWQQKLKKKRINMLKLAIQKLKEWRQSIYSPEQKQSIYTPYLQTQSKHKPNFNKQHHLFLMGFEKFNEILAIITLKSKRTVFSKILRFIAFHQAKPHSKLDSFNNHLDSTDINSKNNAKEEKPTQETPKNVHFIKPVQKQIVTPKKNVKINDCLILQKNEFKTPLKEVQSAKHIMFTNEYALSPPSPIREQLTDKKRPRKQSNFVINNSSSKFSDRNGNRQLLNSKSQPRQLAIGGIEGNFKYQFNQHNYIVVQPQPLHPFINPPSPISHQFVPTIKFHSPQTKQINIQPIPTIVKQSSLNAQKRDIRYVRPHSHNPFITSSQQRKPNSNFVGEDRAESRRPRSISASGNIKISFMTKPQKNTANQVKLKLNDYESDPTQRLQDLHKLGTVENKRLRQHYQSYSYQNQLLPQDYKPAPLTPNYFHSNPISPKPKDFPSPSIHLNYLNPQTQSPLTPRSPRGFIYQSHLPVSSSSKEIPQQMKQSFQMHPGEPKRMSREKILVTSSHRPKQR